MSPTVKTRILKYAITSAVSLAMVYFYASVRDFSTLPLVDKYLVLCDGFTLPGAILVLVGFLLMIANRGGLDGVSYVFSYAFRMLIPGSKKKFERYGDYLERKRGKRIKGFGFLFVVGGVCLAISLVFMALFFSLYGK